jgi:probable O-glycosylation ligase (exosortase A-associated)
MGTAVVSLVRPWVGVVGAYLLVVLRPHAVWWWHFDGLRPAFWLLLPTLIGFAFAFFRNENSIASLKNKRSLFVAVLWLFLTLSFYFGSYVDVVGPTRFTSSTWAISTTHKFFVLYFVACACINSEKSLRVFSFIIIGTGVFFIYWINERYLSGEVFGRIGGPSGIGDTGMYADHNNFAMLFVVALPYIAYFGSTLRNAAFRWSVWALIPFGWHAIFLTGSRGGLLGLGVTLAIMVWRMKNKALGILVFPAFAIAFVLQAGDTMRDRASTITEYSEESSASSRLQAWTAASRMIADNPVLGVGIASFGPAFPYYSTDKPRETHNTYLQIAAESGIVAGVSYLGILLLCLVGLWHNGKGSVGDNRQGSIEATHWINEATLASLSGFAVCAFFLSLQMFEIFWYLCVMANALLFLSPNNSTPAVETSRARLIRERRSAMKKLGLA